LPYLKNQDSIEKQALQVGDFLKHMRISGAKLRDKEN
jgi:hypothetical protein